MLPTSCLDPQIQRRIRCQDHPGDTGRIDRFDENGADDHIGTARLVDGRGTDVVELFTKDCASFDKRTTPEVRAAADNDARRLSARVGIDDLNPLHAFRR